MKTPKERVQEYVRTQIPALKELSFGCRLVVRDTNGKKHTVTYASDADYAGLVWDNGNAGSYVEDWVVKIIGHTPQLQDYLAVLGEKKQLGTIEGEIDGELRVWGYSNPIHINFSLTDGQPKSEKDWEIMSNILGV